MREVAVGFDFPEGPVALTDGTVLVVEIKGGCLTRIDPASGAVTRVAECGGGPNGAAIGPDGRVYICNNGGMRWDRYREFTVPAGPSAAEARGSIQAVDLETGSCEVLYEACGGRRFEGPNDIVFDDAGGFYFTDYGRNLPNARAFGGVYYGRADGSGVEEVLYPVVDPNGIGLSPDGARLYVSMTPSRSVWYWEVEAPGSVRVPETFLQPRGGTLLCGLHGHQPVDSLAVDSEGNVCVATLVTAAITVITPAGAVDRVVRVPGPDPIITNICFGGSDLRTAYVTASGTGKLFAMEWPCPGLRLSFNA